MNIEKHILYWRTGSDEDWEMAEIALANGKIRHGLFFLHLAMEKLIKAHVSQVTQDVPPKIHNLLTLMQRANLPINQTTGARLAELNI
ncbi:MAG: HEPN domain-containing protein [Magnetococcales bacterium]|nr:HEPN domain-containing protein [Magnetococcales bacterium]